MVSSDKNAIDNIRFLSMAAIVALHCRVFTNGAYTSLIFVSVAQVMKFATINFFIISGFLLSEGLYKQSRLEIFRRRCRRLLLPWLIWSTISATGLMAAHQLSLTSEAWTLAMVLRMVMIDSAYWFIPNFLISLAVVLLCRDSLERAPLALVFTGIALFYGLNIYFRWLPTTHTSAVLGYTVYFILGVRLRRSYPSFQQWIEGRSLVVLGALATAAYLFAVGEAEYLKGRTMDPLDTLRISNQLYSIAIFLVLFKIDRILYPAAMNVRRHTFGIYLIHPLLVILVSGTSTRLLSSIYHIPRLRLLAAPSFYIHSELMFALSWLLCFIFIYGLAWFAAAMIAGSRAASAVGMSPMVRATNDLNRHLLTGP